MWVYIRTEPSLYTVGFYAPDGKWNPESDWNHSEEAAKRVAWLNGGTSSAETIAAVVLPIAKRIDAIEAELPALRQVANTASCLANGITPD